MSDDDYGCCYGCSSVNQYGCGCAVYLTPYEECEEYRKEYDKKVLKECPYCHGTGTTCGIKDFHGQPEDYVGQTWYFCSCPAGQAEANKYTSGGK